MMPWQLPNNSRSTNALHSSQSSHSTPKVALKKIATECLGVRGFYASNKNDLERLIQKQKKTLLCRHGAFGCFHCFLTFGVHVFEQLRVENWSTQKNSPIVWIWRQTGPRLEYPVRFKLHFSLSITIIWDSWYWHTAIQASLFKM